MTAGTTRVGDTLTSDDRGRLDACLFNEVSIACSFHARIRASNGGR